MAKQLKNKDGIVHARLGGDLYAAFAKACKYNDSNVTREITRFAKQYVLSCEQQLALEAARKAKRSTKKKAVVPES